MRVTLGRAEGEADPPGGPWETVSLPASPADLSCPCNCRAGL